MKPGQVIELYYLYIYRSLDRSKEGGVKLATHAQYVKCAVVTCNIDKDDQPAVRSVVLAAELFLFGVLHASRGGGGGGGGSSNQTKPSRKRPHSGWRPVNPGQVISRRKFINYSNIKSLLLSEISQHVWKRNSSTATIMSRDFGSPTQADFLSFLKLQVSSKLGA